MKMKRFLCTTIALVGIMATNVFASYGYCDAFVNYLNATKTSTYTYDIAYGAVVYEQSAGKNDVKNIYINSLVTDNKGTVLNTIQKTENYQTSATASGSFSKNFGLNGTSDGKLTLKTKTYGRTRYADDTTYQDNYVDELNRTIDVPKLIDVRTTEVDDDITIKNIAKSHDIDINNLKKVSVEDFENLEKYSIYKDVWFTFVFDEIEVGDRFPEDVYIDQDTNKLYIFELNHEVMYSYECE